LRDITKHTGAAIEELRATVGLLRYGDDAPEDRPEAALRPVPGLDRLDDLLASFRGSPNPNRLNGGRSPASATSPTGSARSPSSSPQECRTTRSASACSSDTVKTHVNRAMMKTGARDRAQLVVFAYESGRAAPIRWGGRRRSR